MYKFLFSALLLVGSLTAKHVYTIPHGTHQHIVRELVNNTTGPIIEFGSGYSSTDMLHNLCKQSKRLLITLDDNQEWLDKFQAKYQNCDWHKFYFVPGKHDNKSPEHWVDFLENNDYIQSLEYAICFVDQSPWLGRYETIKRLKGQSQYTVLHDCNYFPEQGIFGVVLKPLDRTAHTEGEFDFSDILPYFKVYYPDHPWPGHTGPPTLVGSETPQHFPTFD